MTVVTMMAAITAAAITTTKRLLAIGVYSAE
jgi:hypothetical protein